jgi:TatD DNase family protein
MRPSLRVNNEMYVDTHAHLSQLEDRGGVIQRAKEAGVEAIIAMGTNLSSSVATLEWAEAYPGYVLPAIGIHPTEFLNDDVPETLRFIEERISRVVAVGEIGLDYWDKAARKDEGVRERQRDTYTRQLQIAREHDLPASVHGRGSWQDALDIAVAHGPERIVFHWYSGPLDVLDSLLDRGYVISATPAAEYSRDHRAALEHAPMESILVETDCPVYMRNRKRGSEPMDVTITAKALAKLKDTTTEEVSITTTRNARDIFEIK